MSADEEGFGSWGRLILSDWANAGAEVTLTLRSGVQLSGRVRKRPSGAPPEIVTLNSEAGGREVKHDVLLSDVAAITARAS